MGRDFRYLYCDESGVHGRARYFHLGALSMTPAREQIIKTQLKAIRQEFDLTSEMKWTKVSKKYLPIYKKWLDVFLQKSSCRFYFLTVPREQFRTLSKVRYLELYQTLIYKAVGFESRCRIYVDNSDFGQQRDWMKIRYRTNQVRSTRNLALIHPMRSHESDLLQLVDIILGGLAAQKAELTDLALPKKDLMQLLIHARESGKILDLDSTWVGRKRE